MNEWNEEFLLHSKIAIAQPYAAYAAFTHGYLSKLSYLIRTVPNLDQLLLPLELTVRARLIPNLTGRPPPNDLERSLLASPSRHGGLGILILTSLPSTEYSASTMITAPLSKLVREQSHEYPTECKESQQQAKRDVHKTKRKQSKASASILGHNLNPSLKRATTLAQEKGASSWLINCPAYRRIWIHTPQKCV